MAQHEPLLPALPHWLHSKRPRVPRIRLGVPLDVLQPVAAAAGASPAAFAPSAEQRQLHFGALLPHWTVCFAFHRRATEYDLAGAVVHAVSAGARGRRGVAKDYSAALAHPRIVWDDFARLLRAKGWNVSRVHLSNDEGWRFDVK